jgi:hypothetical protein
MAKTKSRKESDKALLASVTEEMAQPRVAESARIKEQRFQGLRLLWNGILLSKRLLPSGSERH